MKLLIRKSKGHVGWTYRDGRLCEAYERRKGWWAKPALYRAPADAPLDADGYRTNAVAWVLDWGRDHPKYRQVRAVIERDIRRFADLVDLARYARFDDWELEELRLGVWR